MTGGRRDVEAFAFARFSAPRSSPPQGWAVRNETGCEGEGKSSSGAGSGRARARRRPFAVQLSMRVGVGERGEDGAVWLPASICCAVSLWLSSPTGAILRSFLLSPRRVGRCRRAPLGRFLFLSRKRYSLGLEILSPKSHKLLASCFTPPLPPFLSFFKKLL